MINKLLLQYFYPGREQAAQEGKKFDDDEDEEIDVLVGM